MIVLCKVHGESRESRWHHGYGIYSSLTDIFSVEGVFLFLGGDKGSEEFIMFILSKRWQNRETVMN